MFMKNKDSNRDEGLPWPYDVMATWSWRIARLKLKRYEVAQNAHITPCHLSLIMNDKVNPSVKSASMIEMFLRKKEKEMKERGAR